MIHNRLLEGAVIIGLVSSLTMAAEHDMKKNIHMNKNSNIDKNIPVKRSIQISDTSEKKPWYKIW